MNEFWVKTTGTALTFPEMCYNICAVAVVWAACLPSQAAFNNCVYGEHIGLMLLCSFIQFSFLNETILPGWGLGRMWFRHVLFLDSDSKALSCPPISQHKPYVITLMSPTLKELKGGGQPLKTSAAFQQIKSNVPLDHFTCSAVEASHSFTQFAYIWHLNLQCVTTSIKKCHIVSQL